MAKSKKKTVFAHEESVIKQLKEKGFHGIVVIAIGRQTRRVQV